MKCFLLLLSALSCSAEYLRIEVKYGGMECASCTSFIQNKLGKTAGVQSVQIDGKTSAVVITLTPGNAVKLRSVRDTVQQSGFAIKEVKTKLRGIPKMDRGVLNLSIPETNETVRLRDRDAKLREYVNRKVEIEANAEIVTSGGARIDIYDVTKGDLVR